MKATEAAEAFSPESVASSLEIEVFVFLGILASFLETEVFVFLGILASLLETEVSSSMENVAYVQVIGTFVFQEILVSYLEIEVSFVLASVIFYLYLVTVASCLPLCISL